MSQALLGPLTLVDGTVIQLVRLSLDELKSGELAGRWFISLVVERSEFLLSGLGGRVGVVGQLGDGLGNSSPWATVLVALRCTR